LSKFLSLLDPRSGSNKANIWRPFDEPREAHHRLNIKVGDNEIKIVMTAFLPSSNLGWNAVLKKVHDTG
jgi:hypothetical protein